MDRIVFFPDAPGDPENSRIVLVPVPFDGTSTWGKGADKGPMAICHASEHLEGLDLQTGTEVYRLGIYTDDPVCHGQGPDRMAEAVADRVGHWLDKGRFVVVLGGEHSVSIGSIMAYSCRISDLTVLQLDAHADLRDTYKGSRYNHACVMARTRELCRTAQVGIRSMDLAEYSLHSPERILFAHQIQTNPDWMEVVLGWLGQDVYITIDLDVFDCSIMPSTGTPEPGGLDWWQVTGLLRLICSQRHVVGFDVVELCPIQGLRGPDFLAAKLVYNVLSCRFLRELQGQIGPIKGPDKSTEGQII